MMRRLRYSLVRRAPAWPMLLLAASCASSTPQTAKVDAASPIATQARSAVALPGALHGFWIREASNCPPPGGAYDGDQMLDISSDRVVGYEEVHTPVAITRLAGRNGWRIETLIDVGPSGVFERGGARVFALEHGMLVVEDGGAINRYRRCPAD